MQWKKRWLDVSAQKIIGTFYPQCMQRVNNSGPIIYFTFDDGPHPEITPWVMEQLGQYNGAATFFCLGKNVEAYPQTFEMLKQSSHNIGNHTYSHCNGFHTSAQNYAQDVAQAAALITSSLFRPPYGKLLPAQYKQLIPNYKIIMWDVLTWDFSLSMSADDCIKYATHSIRPGSIVVMHDSEKAWPRLQKLLPFLLAYFSEKKYTFDRI